VPWAAASIVGSVFTPLFATRARPAFVMAGGLVIAAGGFGILAQVGGSFGLPSLVTGSVLLSLGLAPLTTVATDMMVGVVAPERAGLASSISETSSELGGALGIAVLGSIGSIAYRSYVANVVPADVPIDVVRAASRTIGEATALAERLPGPIGVELLHVTREAFAASFVVMGGICGAMAIATAVASAVLLRHVPAAAAGGSD
jgi:MFS transporter, DHA2 family, multidrug resistance protein